MIAHHDEMLLRAQRRRQGEVLLMKKHIISTVFFCCTHNSSSFPINALAAAVSCSIPAAALTPEHLLTTQGTISSRRRKARMH